MVNRAFEDPVVVGAGGGDDVIARGLDGGGLSNSWSSPFGFSMSGVAERPVNVD